ncbi:MAG: type III pantothenate kinase [Gammaproteobacteria bacterium]|nr:type III pantothenate kinase [Gammaproteobacteria bacterium]
MILLLDAGNSRLKWAVLRNGHFEHGGVLEQSGDAIKELASAAWGELDAPEAVLVANVAGEPLRRALNSWVKRHWKLAPEYVVACAEQCGIRNAYAEPNRLGVDRWLALLAARELFQGPLCIVDCGTALTIDALAQDNRHLGGLIIPGLQLMREALAGRAEAIREQMQSASHEQVRLLGADTGSAVVGGTLYAEIAVIDRVLDDLRTELGNGLRCVLTGGDAARLQPLLATRVHYEADLVLRGLARVARERSVEATQQDRSPGAAAANVP